MQYICICRESESNTILDSQQINGLTGAEVCKAFLKSEEQLWKRLPYICVPINMESPLISECSDILSKTPAGNYSLENFCLYQFPPNYISNEKIIFFFKVIHNTKWTFPDYPISYLVSDIDDHNVSDFLEYIKETYSSFIVPSEIFVSGEVLENFTPMSTLFALAQNSQLAISVTFQPNFLKKVALRDNVIKEIIETEKSYVSDLKFLHTYYRPKMLERELISEEEALFIFKDVYEIRETHKQFYKALKHSYSDYATLIAQVFMEFSEKFKVSIPFISTYNRVEDYLVKKKHQNKTFQMELAKLEAEKPNNVNVSRDIFSYLITIIQRLPRYLLFLKSLISSTPISNPDKHYLEGASENLSNANRDADETLLKDRMQQELSHLQQKIGNSISIMVNAYSQIILKSTITIPGNSQKNIVIYLTTDFVIILGESGTKAVCLLLTPSPTFHYYETEEPNALIIPFFFHESDRNYKNRKETFVCFKNVEERNTFLNEVLKLQNSIKERSPSVKILTWKRKVIPSLSPQSQHTASALYYQISPFYQQTMQAVPQNNKFSRPSLGRDRFSISMSAKKAGQDFSFSKPTNSSLNLPQPNIIQPQNQASNLSQAQNLNKNQPQVQNQGQNSNQTQNQAQNLNKNQNQPQNPNQNQNQNQNQAQNLNKNQSQNPNQNQNQNQAQNPNSNVQSSQNSASPNINQESQRQLEELIKNHGLIFYNNPFQKNLLLIFGGSNTGPHFTTFSLLSEKVGLVPSGLPARRKHTMVQLGQSLYLIGGYSQSKEVMDIRGFNLISNIWENISFGDDVLGRVGHTSVPYQNQIFIYGGKTGSKGILDELLAFNPKERSIKKIYASEKCRPPARYGHSAVVYDHSMYVFGGKGNNGLLSDLWCFDFDCYVWRQMPLLINNKSSFGAFPHLNTDSISNSNTNPLLSGRWNHQAITLGSDMIIIKGTTNLGPAPSICISLLTFSVSQVLEVGNCPLALSNFSLTRIKPTEMLIYGGCELKAKNPSNALYFLTLSEMWGKAVQKFEISQFRSSQKRTFRSPIKRRKSLNSNSFDLYNYKELQDYSTISNLPPNLNFNQVISQNLNQNASQKSENTKQSSENQKKDEGRKLIDVGQQTSREDFFGKVNYDNHNKRKIPGKIKSEPSENDQTRHKPKFDENSMNAEKSKKEKAVPKVQNLTMYKEQKNFRHYLNHESYMLKQKISISRYEQMSRMSQISH